MPKRNSKLKQTTECLTSYENKYRLALSGFIQGRLIAVRRVKDALCPPKYTPIKEPASKEH